MVTRAELLAPVDGHAVFGASAFHRIIPCPASVQLSHGIERTSSVYANEGNDAHDYVEDMLVGNFRLTEAYYGIKKGLVTIDAETAGYFNSYYDYCTELEGPDPLYRSVEMHVNYGHLAPDGQGTADFVCLTHDGTLHVVDFKYGAGVKVYAPNNFQLFGYLAGVYDILSLMYEIREMHVHIHQPRLNHTSPVQVTEIELNWFKHQLAISAEKALAPNPPFLPGESQCRWCPGKDRCPAIMDAMREDVLEEFEDLEVGEEELPDFRVPSQLTTEELDDMLTVIPLYEDFLKSLRDRAHTELNEGKQVGDWKLVAGRAGTRQWTDPGDVETYLRKKKMLVRDIFPPGKIISPAQLAKKKPNLLKELAGDNKVFQKIGKPTLAPGTDPRPAVVVVAEEFKDET